MSKKHYMRLAAALRPYLVMQRLAHEEKPDLQMLHGLCIALKKDNTNFNRSKFLVACGLSFEEWTGDYHGA